MPCVLSGARIYLNGRDQFHGPSSFLVDSRFDKYSSFVSPSGTTSSKSESTIVTCLALLKVHSQVPVCPCSPNSALKILLTFKRDDFPFLAVCVCVCVALSTQAAGYHPEYLSSPSALMITWGPACPVVPS